MKYLRLTLVPLCVLWVASAKERQNNAEQNEQSNTAKVAVVSLHELLKNKGRYKDQRIVLAAYFVTHMEGPWICAENGDSKKRLLTTLSVTNVADANFKVTPAMRSRLVANFGERGVNKDLPEYVLGSEALGAVRCDNGIPALFTGTFRVGDYRLSNDVLLKEHPYIVLTEVCEVEPNNPQWNSAQPKGEPAGADQPATNPADKPPVKDQPSTPTPKVLPR